MAQPKPIKIMACFFKIGFQHSSKSEKHRRGKKQAARNWGKHVATAPFLTTFKGYTEHVKQL